MKEILSKETRKKLAKLEALERGGVDNWEWYDESLKSLVEEEEKEEAAIEVLDEILSIVLDGVYEPSERGGGVAVSEEKKEEAVNYLLSQVKEFNTK